MCSSDLREADLGLTGGEPQHLIYIDGKPASKLTSDNLVDQLEVMIREKAAVKQATLDQLLARG